MNYFRSIGIVALPTTKLPIDSHKMNINPLPLKRQLYDSELAHTAAARSPVRLTLN